jgi:hypothetical protein
MKGMKNIKRLLYRNMEHTWVKLDRGVSALVFRTDMMSKLQHPRIIVSIDSMISGQCRADLNKIKNQQIKL